MTEETEAGQACSPEPGAWRLTVNPFLTLIDASENKHE
jgi:hypothetical protein